MRLYLKYMKVHFMSQMAYRTSFILLSIGQFFVPFMIFISMILFFQRFDTIMGWELYEVTLCYSVIHMAFSISECFARGFDAFSNLIRTGQFDRLMVRPRSTLLQVFGSKFEFTRIGRLLQSVLVLVVSLMNLNIDFNPLKILTLILMISCGVVVFTGIYMLGATLCFFTIEGIEIINIFTDGGREMAQYPLGIYKKWVQKFFTFVIPFGVINYYPLMYILDKTQKTWYGLLPLTGVLFLIPCFLIWQVGVRQYKSTGS